MVALVGRLVDLAAQGAEGLAVEDMVDAHDEGTIAEGEAEAVAASDEGVLEPVADLAAGVGERRVVEVAADQHTGAVVGLDQLVEDHRLGVVVAEGRAELGAQGVLELEGLALLREGDVVGTVVGLEVEGLEVYVHQQ